MYGNPNETTEVLILNVFFNPKNFELKLRRSSSGGRRRKSDHVFLGLVPSQPTEVYVPSK
jgi:hypothetical protein